MLAVVSRVSQRVSFSAEDAVELDKEIREAMTRLADGIEIYDADASAAPTAIAIINLFIRPTPINVWRSNQRGRSAFQRVTPKISAK